LNFSHMEPVVRVSLSLGVLVLSGGQGMKTVCCRLEHAILVALLVFLLLCSSLHLYWLWWVIFSCGRQVLDACQGFFTTSSGLWSMLFNMAVQSAFRSSGTPARLDTQQIPSR